MALSSNVIALVLALLSVSALAIPPIVKVFSSTDSNLRLSHPVIRGNTLYLVASNTGVRPGIIETVSVVGRYLDGLTTVEPATPADTFVSSGSKQVAFRIEPRLSSRRATSMASSALRAASQLKSSETTIIFAIRQAHGAVLMQKFNLSHGDMESVMTRHAERCLAEEQETIQNRCVGLEDIREENDQLHKSIQES